MICLRRTVRVLHFRGDVAASARCRLETYAADIFPTRHNDCDDLTGAPAGRQKLAAGGPLAEAIRCQIILALGMDVAAASLSPCASMLDKSRLYRDCFALALLALVVFLSLALVSYDPADAVADAASRHCIWSTQPDPLVYPANAASAQHLWPYWGARRPTHCLPGLALALITALLSLAVLDYQLLRRREIDMPGTANVRLDRLARRLDDDCGDCVSRSVARAGRSVPAAISARSARRSTLLHFATVGGLILASSVTLGGLLLCTDYAPDRNGSFSLQRSPACRSERPADKPISAKFGGRKAQPDRSGRILPGDVSVKIRGKPAEVPRRKVAEDEAKTTRTDRGAIGSLHCVSSARRR